MPSHPRTDHTPKDVLEDDLYVHLDGYEVASWSPSKAAEGVPPTEVHLILHYREGMHFVLRLKSERAARELIDILEEHTDYVFPKTAQ